MDAKAGLQELERTKLIAILRNISPERIAVVTQALLHSGLKVMEITLNTPGALEMIQSLRKEYDGRMFIGAGTVIRLQDAEQAVQAGAGFLVTPNVNADVIEFAAKQGIPVYPGALTPTEIVQAWELGATAVKVFPCSSMGPGYIKELCGPLNHIPMVAVGGVTADNVSEWIKAGCKAVGAGGSLVKPYDAESGNGAAIQENASRFIAQLTS